MAFNKVRETLYAFRGLPEGLSGSVRKRLENHSRILIDAMVKKRETKAVHLFIFLFIVVPVFFLVIYLSVMMDASESGGLSLAFVFGLGTSRLYNWLTSKIPFYKLNPYLGMKLEDTANDLRTSD